MANEYCLYARVSTKRQGDSGLGLDAQQTIARHFYPDISKEFIEVRSGKNIEDRPVLSEAIEYCLEHDAVLVVAKVDRLTRDTKDGLEILERLKGRIRFCDLPGEPDKFMLTLFFAFAERERQLISIRTKTALESAKRSGKKLGVSSPSGGRRPWDLETSRMGSETMRQKSRNNKNNIRAFTIALEMFNNGSSYRAISDKLNESDFNTPTGRGKWSVGSVYRLLSKYDE
jgi:DNA invertase Pin-like site-specific DNA recombinase